MTDIPLIQRTETGARRAGAVKPGFDLAEGGEIAQIGQFVTKFSGAVYDKLIKVQAANEVAEGKGQVSSLIEGFSNLVAENPNASFDELQEEWNKVSDQIKAIPETLKTGLAGDAMTQWLALREETINKQAHGKMFAIKNKQQADRFQVQRELNILNLDDAALEVQYADMRATGNFDNVVLDAQEQIDLSVIDKAQSKVAVGNASQRGFDVWQETVTPEDPDGDLNAGFAVINAIEGLTGAQKQNAESEMKTRIENRRAEARLELKQAEDAAVEEINKRLNKGQLDGITDFINTLSLTETKKNEQIKTANAFVKSINDAKEETVTSDETNIKIDQIIDDVRRGRMTYDEGIVEYSTLSAGVKASEGGGNLNDIRKAADSSVDPTLLRPVVKRGGSLVERMKNLQIGFVKADDSLDDDEKLVDISAIEARAFKNQTELDEWAILNKDDPNFNEKFQKQVNDLYRSEIEEVTLNMFQRIFTHPTLLRKKRLKALRKEPSFKALNKADQARVEDLIAEGLTIPQALGNADFPEPKNQAEFDAIPSGTQFKDTDGKIKVKK